jgi:hypothetical protein
MAQIYLGKTKKALGLFVIDAGILSIWLFSDSILMRLLAAGIYLITFLPACVEGYQLARYGKNILDTSADWYVIILLLTTGFSALPLLWQSPNFSKNSKIAWTAAVPVLAVLFFGIIIKYWAGIEAYLRDLAG